MWALSKKVQRSISGREISGMSLLTSWKNALLLVVDFIKTLYLIYVF
jgi:hypothetical protein